MNFGEKMKKARGEMQQRDVAKALGISQSALCMYENGERAPRDELKIKIAEFYGTTVGSLFFDEKVHVS